MSFWSNILKKMFTLDHQSDFIYIFNQDCKLEKSLISYVARENKGTIMQSFTFSEKNLRLGAILSNGSFSLWDSSENFDNEINISTKIFSTWIYFIEFSEEWITCDKNGTIHFWDQMLNESVKELRLAKECRGSIISSFEISTQKLIGVATTDATQCIIDPYKNIITASLLMAKGGISQMKFFYSYQCLLISGYDNVVPIFTQTPLHNDMTMVGKLEGHLSNVTAIEVIEGTPMVLTVDDVPVIRSWDIRRFQCLQSVEFSHKLSINRLLCMNSVSKLAQIGKRINVINYVPINDNIHGLKKHNYPLSVEVDIQKGLLYLCTVNDIKIMDLFTGKTKKIMINLVNTEDIDELSKFILIENSRRFTISDFLGNIMLYRTKTGELIQKMDGHKSQVTNLVADTKNNLLISASSDSCIKVHSIIEKVDLIDQSLDQQQMLGKNIGNTCIRTISNMFNGASVDILDFSVYQSLIVCSSGNHEVLFQDYENFKIKGLYKLHRDEEITYLKFLEGFYCLFVSTNKGNIYLLHVQNKNLAPLEMNCISMIDFKVLEWTDKPTDFISYVTKIYPAKGKITKDFDEKRFSEMQNDQNSRWTSLKIDSGQDTPFNGNKFKKCYKKFQHVYFAFNDGSMMRMNLKDVVIGNWKKCEKAYMRGNYNTKKVFEEDYSKQIQIGKIIIKDVLADLLIYSFIGGGRIDAIEAKLEEQQQQKLQNKDKFRPASPPRQIPSSKTVMFDKTVNDQNPTNTILITNQQFQIGESGNVCDNNDNNENNNNSSSPSKGNKSPKIEFEVGTDNAAYSLLGPLLGLNGPAIGQEKPKLIRKQGEISKMLHQNIINEFYPNLHLINYSKLIRAYKPLHKCTINTILVGKMPELKVITTSIDETMIISNKKLEILCKYNVNHPQPMLWNLSFTEDELIRENLMKILQFLNEIFSNKPSSSFKNATQKDKDIQMIKNTMRYMYTHKSVKNEKNVIDITPQNVEDGAEDGYVEKANQKICLMKDEYCRKDQAFDQIRENDIADIVGPSLKEFKIIRKAYMAKLNIKKADGNNANDVSFRAEYETDYDLKNKDRKNMDSTTTKTKTQQLDLKSIKTSNQTDSLPLVASKSLQNPEGNVVRNLSPEQMLENMGGEIPGQLPEDKLFKNTIGTNGITTNHPGGKMNLIRKRASIDNDRLDKQDTSLMKRTFKTSTKSGFLTSKAGNTFKRKLEIYQYNDQDRPHIAINEQYYNTIPKNASQGEVDSVNEIESTQYGTASKYIYFNNNDNSEETSSKNPNNGVGTKTAYGMSKFNDDNNQAEDRYKFPPHNMGLMTSPKTMQTNIDFYSYAKAKDLVQYKNDINVRGTTEPCEQNQNQFEPNYHTEITSGREKMDFKNSIDFVNQQQRSLTHTSPDLQLHKDSSEQQYINESPTKINNNIISKTSFNNLTHSSWQRIGVHSSERKSLDNPWKDIKCLNELEIRRKFERPSGYGSEMHVYFKTILDSLDKNITKTKLGHSDRRYQPKATSDLNFLSKVKAEQNVNLPIKSYRSSVNNTKSGYIFGSKSNIDNKEASSNSPTLTKNIIGKTNDFIANKEYKNDAIRESYQPWPPIEAQDSGNGQEGSLKRKLNTTRVNSHQILNVSKGLLESNKMLCNQIKPSLSNTSRCNNNQQLLSFQHGESTQNDFRLSNLNTANSDTKKLNQDKIADRLGINKPTKKDDRKFHLTFHNKKLDVESRNYLGMIPRVKKVPLTQSVTSMTQKDRPLHDFQVQIGDIKIAPSTKNNEEHSSMIKTFNKDKETASTKSVVHEKFIKSMNGYKFLDMEESKEEGKKDNFVVKIDIGRKDRHGLVKCLDDWGWEDLSHKILKTKEEIFAKSLKYCNKNRTFQGNTSYTRKYYDQHGK